MNRNRSAKLATVEAKLIQVKELLELLNDLEQMDDYGDKQAVEHMSSALLYIEKASEDLAAIK